MNMHPQLFPVPDSENAASNIFVMPSLFRETMDIIFDSHEYFELHEALHPDFTPTHIQTLISNEMSRITMRLTSVMAWLMARKAVASGQLSEEEAAAQYSIEGEEYCLRHYTELDEVLPDYIVELLERSHNLYLRVWRIEHQHD